MVAPVEIGMGGVELLVDNGLLKQHQVNGRHAVGEACLAALEQSEPRPMVPGPWDRAKGLRQGPV